MPSAAYRRWVTARRNALDEIAHAQVATDGTKRGRRFATQQLNQGYALLLAAHFQGFCRDLHTECVDSLLTALAPPPLVWPLLQREFTRGRYLDRSNAQPASLGADFGRLDFDFWAEVVNLNARNRHYQSDLEQLNEWRNAIAHQDFNPARLGGTASLRLLQVKRWRVACRRLARAFDEVVRRRMEVLTGATPW
jgi:hypothetical protein